MEAKIDTIRKMIDDSTWRSTDQKYIYTFITGNKLMVNDKKHFAYYLRSVNKRVQIQLGSDKKYSVEYIDDFTLDFINENGRVRLMPA
jgi:hypothetical protein